MQVLKISDVLGADRCFGAALMRMSAHPAMDQIMKAHQAKNLLKWLSAGYATLVSSQMVKKIEAVASTFASEEGSG